MPALYPCRFLPDLIAIQSSPESNAHIGPAGGAQWRGSSSLLGKQSNVIIMDFLDSTTTQIEFDKLDWR